MTHLLAATAHTAAKAAARVSLPPNPPPDNQSKLCYISARMYEMVYELRCSYCRHYKPVLVTNT